MGKIERADEVQALGFDLAIDDGYNLNYITPEVVAYLGLPRLQRTYPYTMEGCKVTEGSQTNIMGTSVLWIIGEHLYFLFLRSEVRGLPPSQSNSVVHPSLGKDSYVGTNMMNGGTQVPAKESKVECVMDALRECPNIQGKEDLSCGHQGTIAKLSTFTIANEQSVNVSLSLCEPIDSLLCVDNVLIESVDTLDDPIDDRIDSSSKIDLCPPSVETYALNASSLFCNDCVDQPVCECSSLVEGSCNVIKKPQFGGTNDNVDHLHRSDSLIISFVGDPTACFVHRDHALENASKNDMFPFEGELACFNSSLVVDHSLFKYNILFEDDEITPTDVPSGVGLESSVILDNYTFYSDPLWCEAFPPKDVNLFLEDESTFVGNVMRRKVMCVFPLLLLLGKSANLVNGCALDPSTWLAFPFDPSSELNCSICLGMFGRNGKHMGVDIVNSFSYAVKLFLRRYLQREGEVCPFLYYLFAYDEITSWIRSALHAGQGILVVHTCWYDPVLWTLYPFDPSECMKVFKLVGVSFFGWYYRVVEKNDHCPCSPLVDFKAMIIEDVWLFHEFESPRLNAFNANLCTTHHAKRISFLLMIYMVLQGLDSRTHFYLLAYDGTHTCVGCISYVSSGINWANESLLDSMLCNPFPFDPGVVFKCAECGSNTICHLHDSSVVLLLDPMCLNEVCLPIWVEDTYVLEPTHELGIIILLKLSSALDGVLIWVNTTYAFALRYESVNVLLDIREVLCFFGCGTNEGLHMRLFKCIGSFTLTLCQFVLLSQVSLALMGYRPFVDIYDAWLYVKFEHPWHGDEIVIANANPHAMRIFVLFASPIVLLGMHSRTNPFQEGENDVVMNQIPLRRTGTRCPKGPREPTCNLCLLCI
ncbi:hypothetical protein KY285_026412 [Solanum tuberosum]|nr:hypothetical protein KY285_026412 [Solanum tuberosum]